ncbi:MAG: hypothetical protein ACI4F7_11570 [Acutalibacteraceae bacterium]
MMPFSEKLTFLMHITETENKELAAVLSVDPSMISLMRTGKRKLSKDPSQAKKMASFFAGRCSAPFQRQALSDMLNKVSISPSMPTEVLAVHLEEWLRGEKDLAGTVLSGIQAFASQGYDLKTIDSSPAPLSDAEKQTMFFYGSEGRREVMSRVMQEIRGMEAPSSILTVIDDNLEWLLSDYLLTQKVQAALMETMAKGFTFFQIMPPLNYINRYTESLQFWLPIYAAGQTNVYYYPRLRGNLYRHSIIVIPDRCVQYSASVGLTSTSDITMFSTDPRLVKAFENQFEELVSLCRPALNVYRSVTEASACFPKFFSSRGETVQAINSLSINSMPPEVIRWCMDNTDDLQWAHAFKTILDKQPSFEEHFKDSLYIDMCGLATAQEVRSGLVPVSAPVSAQAGRLYYTCETYCIHLKNILRLMEQYENYYFLPLGKKDTADYNLFANESGTALLVPTEPPIKVLEISRPAMATAFREHLLRKADAVGCDGIYREKARMELRALIQELSSSL